jgi:hypothetical protein
MRVIAFYLANELSLVIVPRLAMSRRHGDTQERKGKLYNKKFIAQRTTAQLVGDLDHCQEAGAGDQAALPRYAVIFVLPTRVLGARYSRNSIIYIKYYASTGRCQPPSTDDVRHRPPLTDGEEDQMKTEALLLLGLVSIGIALAYSDQREWNIVDSVSGQLPATLQIVGPPQTEFDRPAPKTLEPTLLQTFKASFNLLQDLHPEGETQTAGTLCWCLYCQQCKCIATRVTTTHPTQPNPPTRLVQATRPSPTCLPNTCSKSRKDL